MRRVMVGSLFCLLPLALGAQSPLPVGSLTISAPRTVATLDMGKLKGMPSRMAWSPDGSELYIQTIEGPVNQATSKYQHYVFKAADGSKKDVSSEPDWAAKYWAAKSDRGMPGVAGVQIDLKTEHKVQQATSAPMGGDMARGGPEGSGTGEAGGSSIGEAASAALNRQTVTVHTMSLKGEPIGEFVNAVIVPGYTYGWGPAGSEVMVYAAPKGGKVLVLNAAGQRQEIRGTGDAVLPAWSPDGKRIAWLQKDGRREFLLQVSDVSAS